MAHKGWTKAQLLARIEHLEVALAKSSKRQAELRSEAEAMADIARKRQAEYTEAVELAALRGQEVALWRGRFEGACVSSARMTASEIDAPGQYREVKRDLWGNAI